MCIRDRLWCDNNRLLRKIFTEGKSKMSIQENIAEIRARIDRAARSTGRTGADITLVGASKMNDAAACQEAIAAGIDVLVKTGYRK